MTALTVPAQQLQRLVDIVTRGVPWSHAEADKAERLVAEIRAKGQLQQWQALEAMRDGASRYKGALAALATEWQGVGGDKAALLPAQDGDESGW